MLSSQRLLIARRTTNGAVATAAAAASSAASAAPSSTSSSSLSSTAQSSSLQLFRTKNNNGAASGSGASSLGVFRASPLRLGWGDAAPVGLNNEELPSQLTENDDGGGDVSFDFGDEGDLLPAAPVPPATLQSPSVSAAALKSSAAPVHKMEIPKDAAASSSIPFRQPLPPKTVTLPDGTETLANEFMAAPTADVIDMVRNYLSQRIINAPVEHKLFTALLARSEEFTADQLLDVLEKHFPPQTNELWGDRVKLMVRDRCMTEAAGMQPLAVARAIVLVGINGRSRRDVDFFKKMCKILALHINEIKDPHTLCYVLVGLQSSRIRPPDSFLALVGRRFPVLNKRNPLHALPAYRALTFFSRAEYPLMNPYRYLADRVMSIVRDNLRVEGKGGQFDGLGRRVDGDVTGSANNNNSAKVNLMRGAEGEEADDDVNELSSEDLDILKGLKREESSSSPAATTAAVSAAPAATFGGWGQPAAPPAPSPDAVAEGSNSKMSSTAEKNEEDDDGEDDDLSADGKKIKKSSSNPIEDALRSADAIPFSLKQRPMRPAEGNMDPKLQQSEGEDAESSQTGDSNNDNNKRSTPSSSALRRAPQTPGEILAHFQRTTGGLSPQQFVRFLFVLAMRRAPRQQYLRPIATDLLVPIVPHLAPPTFMRLVISLRLFQSEDKALLSAVLDRLHDEGPAKVCLRNLFELLRLFGNQATPIDVARPHLLRFMQLCKGAFQDESRLRAKDMLAITGECRNIYAKLRQDGEDGAAVFGLGNKTFSLQDEWIDAVMETRTTTAAAAAGGEEGEATATATAADGASKAESSEKEAESNKEKSAEELQKEEEEQEKVLSEREKQNQQAIAAIEEMFEIVERFAQRMTNLMSLGVLALTNAETLLEICRTLPMNKSTAVALTALREARNRVDEEEGGPDAYAEILDIDVREIFFRIQVINNYDTFRSFRPLPANMIQDFKGMLDSMRCDFIIEAVHVYEQAFPGTLSVPVRRVLARHCLEKMMMEMMVLRGGAVPVEPEPSKLSASGRLIEVEKAKAEAAAQAAREMKDARDAQFGFGAAAGKFRVRYVDDAVAAGVSQTKFYQPYDCTNPRFQLMLFNAKKFNKFVNMLSVTPLRRVKNSDITWAYVEAKANKLSLLQDDSSSSSSPSVSSHIQKILSERKSAIEAAALAESERLIRDGTSGLQQQQQQQMEI